MNRTETVSRRQSRLPIPHMALPIVRWRSRLFVTFILTLSLASLGGSSVPAGMMIWRSIDTISQAWDWDFVWWEVDNIAQKAYAEIGQPLRSLAPPEQSALVRAYMHRASEINRLQWQIDDLYAQPVAQTSGAPPLDTDPGEVARRQGLQARLAVLREQQALVRPAVEEAIERQVGTVLREQGIGAGWPAFPPVWFTFTEPPRKLVASPRASIATAYYAMLQSNLPADAREQIETEIFEKYNLSAYVTQIGGLGAFPAIVTDQASLPWVLSTVAHEWVHNYLTLFPLGFNYATTNDVSILNETVAEIAGDELGAAVLLASYPELAYLFPGKDEPPPSPATNATPPFDFNQEMRHTRMVVDQFLTSGRVEDAEEYMQIRRQLFHENGYPIRKLNQAYFAFHGSYGTGPAASSPIGPKLQQLRALTPDLRTFLETVRWFTSPADLDAALLALSTDN